MLRCAVAKGGRSPGIMGSFMSTTAVAAFMLAAPLFPAGAQTLSGTNGNTVTSDADITASSLGAYANGGKVNLAGGTITITGTGAGSKFGIEAENTGIIESVANIVMAGIDQWYAVYAKSGGTIILKGGTITSTENGVRGLYTSGTGSNISGTIDINISGNNTEGANIQNGGILNLTGGTITASGSGGSGVVTGTNTLASLTNVTINTSGNNRIGVQAYGMLTIAGGSVTCKRLTWSRSLCRKRWNDQQHHHRHYER